METIKQNARVNDGGPISSRLLFEKLESCVGRKPWGVVKVALGSWINEKATWGI